MRPIAGLFNFLSYTAIISEIIERREHAAGEGSAKNEEWKNFLSLTSGVDDVLKKTQDDLDRIKVMALFSVQSN